MIQRFLTTKTKGFTLAELLISLAVLGVIATFTIPKVLQGGQNSEWNASAKEVAGTISAAYDAYRLENTPTATTGAADLMPYINYVRIDTSSQIDNKQTTNFFDCLVSQPCYKLHNGGILMVLNACTFGGTGNNNATFFVFDPDGVYSGSPTGNGKSIEFALYHSGRISTWGDMDSPTQSGCGPWNANPTYDPPWFSW